MNRKPSNVVESQPLDVPVATIDFLAARLGDERAAGNRSAAGLAMMRDVVADLHAGAAPPLYAVRLLLLAYTRHPDYDPAWTEALDAAARAAHGSP